MIAGLGALIGAVSFSGSMIAFAKLQGLINRSWRFRGQQTLNLLVLGAARRRRRAPPCPRGPARRSSCSFVLAVVYGVLMTLPIGGADMPVLISLFNACTGLAVGLEGYVLNNAAMIIAGTVVGAAGSLLTQLMAKAMNRSLAHVLFSGFGEELGVPIAGPAGKSLKPIDATDAAIMLAYSGTVIIVPGYGMAVAQAQHKIAELAKLLEAHGVDVMFAIHPVAGRMPGHMNVLLAEAGVPYDKLHDLEEVNAAFAHADVALVIGANDVVNPSARTDTAEPHLRHADSQRRSGEKRDRHQARPRRRLLRHRERLVLRGQHAHALRRRAGRGQSPDPGAESAVEHCALAWHDSQAATVGPHADRTFSCLPAERRGALCDWRCPAPGV